MKSFGFSNVSEAFYFLFKLFLLYRYSLDIIRYFFILSQYLNKYVNRFKAYYILDLWVSKLDSQNVANQSLNLNRK
jgi:hypothetical protein